MARIGIIIKNFQVGGAQKQSMILAKVLKDKHDITLIIFNGNSLNKRFLNIAENLGLNPYILKGNLFIRLLNCYRIWKRNQVSIIFSYLAGDNLITSILGKLARAKYLVGGIRNSEIEPLKLLIQKFLTNRVFTYVIFNNETGMNALIQKGFKKEKCLLIDNAIVIDLPPIIRKVREKLIIITMARFENQKDHFTAIKSIHYLMTNRLINPDIIVTYYIIGTGRLRETIEKWIDQYNMTEIIEVLVEPTDIEHYMQEADIYLSTSLFEGISNSIMEAMLYSLPIVATHVGDNHRLIDEGINGFLVPVKDHEYIALKLAHLINCPENRIRFGRAGYSLLSERFSIGKFLFIYENLITLMSKTLK